MSDRLVRILVARSLGLWIPPPLRPFLETLYEQIDYIESERDFLIWLTILRRLPEVFRRTGVQYKIVEHWKDALERTPMEFFDAAKVEMKDWRNLFYRIEDDAEVYRKFWQWVSNPFQIRMWLGEVVRKFHANILTEHNEMLELQRNPGQKKEKPEEGAEEGAEQPAKPEKPAPTEENPLDPAQADTWEEAEGLARKQEKLRHGPG